MVIAVIDGMGGGIGAQIILSLREELPTYMDEFISCCFLPHTNIDAFPSVKAILEG